MIFRAAPQYGQCTMLISNTRLSKRAQLMRIETTESGAFLFISDGYFCFFAARDNLGAKLVIRVSTSWNE